MCQVSEVSAPTFGRVHVWQRGDRRGASKDVGVYVHLGSVVSYKDARRNKQKSIIRTSNIWVLVVRESEGSSSYHRAGSGDASVCTQEPRNRAGPPAAAQCLGCRVYCEPLEAARTRNNHTDDAALCEPELAAYAIRMCPPQRLHKEEKLVSESTRRITARNAGLRHTAT